MLKKLSIFSQYKRIALFGGSFNPPHLGHREVAEYLAELKKFDEIWILPTYAHPFDKSLLPFDQRLQLVELNFKNLDKKIKIMPIEGELKLSPSYTIDVIHELKKRYPKHHFTIVVGSDCRNNLSEWKEAQKLREEAAFFIIPRAGFEPSPFTEMSSSKIRTRLQNKEDCTALLNADVLEWIEKQGWYGV